MKARLEAEQVLMAGCHSMLWLECHKEEWKAEECHKTLWNVTVYRGFL